MQEKIVVNLMLEGVKTSDPEDIKTFVSSEIQKLLDGDDTSIDWDGRIIGITTKNNG